MGGPGFQDPRRHEDPPGDWMAGEELAALAAALADAGLDDEDPEEEEPFLSPEEREAAPVTGGWFASGGPFDAAPGGAALAGFADAAAGEDDSCAGMTDDELTGVIRAWHRVEAHACARKHSAVAELIRRRPAPGCEPEGPARLPPAWDEFCDDELAEALGESRYAAGALLDTAALLETRLPGTMAAFRAGTLSRNKADIIARACELLDPAEAAAAEALVLGRAGRLTPGGLRAAIGRAVIAVAPGKARKRREAAARNARVERWAEDSGNAALAGRELPPAEALAADQRVTAWAHELKKAGLDGSMDELRVRAYLDLLLGLDSRPPAPASSHSPAAASAPASAGAASPDPDGPDPAGGPGSGKAGRPDPGGSDPVPSPLAGPVPAGFAAKG